MDRRLTPLRYKAATVMDVMADVLQAVVLMVALWAAWRCWALAEVALAKAGGLPSLPRGHQEWSQFWTGTRMMLQDERGRAVLMARGSGLFVAWFYIVAAVALTVFSAVGLRWAYARLRDAVAGA